MLNGTAMKMASRSIDRICTCSILVFLISKKQTNKQTNRPFPSSPGPLFQNEGRCPAFDMEIIFHSHANKIHFHKKGCAPS